MGDESPNGSPVPQKRPWAAIDGVVRKTVILECDIPGYRTDAAQQRGQEQAVLDRRLTQCYCCVVIPQFDEDGLLPPGIHWASWSEFLDRFGTSAWRQLLAAGVRAAVDNLKSAGCPTVYIDGSFVTGKEVPNDFDACWEEAGVDPTALYPVLLTFDSGRVTQKAKYLGELFPASAIADGDGFSFLEFFQTDKETGRPKGIIAIDLGDLG